MNQKEFLIISFTIFLTVFAWAIADIYHAAKLKSLLKNIPTSESLNIKFEGKVFDNLRVKAYE